MRNCGTTTEIDGVDRVGVAAAVIVLSSGLLTLLTDSFLNDKILSKIVYIILFFGVSIISIVSIPKIHTKSNR